MSVKHIGSAWKTQMRTGFPQDVRCYIDFRQREYLDEGVGSPTYTLIGSSENRPGSHDLTGGYVRAYLDMPTTFTIRACVRPEFAYTTGSDQPVWSWANVAATQFLRLYYQASSDKIVLEWYEGGTARTLESQQFDDGTSFDDIDQDLTIDCVVDLTTGGITTGSALYVNGTSRDTAWSGNIDAKAANYYRWTLRAHDATVGNYSINHVRLYDGLLAVQADITSDFKSVETEEFFWSCDGHATGHTRVNVSQHFHRFSLERSVIDVLGTRTSNDAEIQLYNRVGEFSDDQYVTFDPANDGYNGTSAQAYLHNRCRVWVEHWDSGLFETVFKGRIDDSKFARSSDPKTVSTVKLTCHDIVNEIERYVVVNGVKFENFKMCDPAAEATSLVHVLARLATQRKIKQYLSDSFFNSATPANSWAKDANVTIARAAGDWSDFLLQASTTAGGEDFYQQIDFESRRKLNAGETYTFAIYLRSASAFTGNLRLRELDSGGINATSSTAFSLTAGENFTRLEVTRTITDGDSDELRVHVEMTTTGTTLECAWASLTQSKEAPKAVLVNNAEGTAGVTNADAAVAVSWDLVGFDTVAVNITHPWAVIEKFKSPWASLRLLATATLAQYLGADAAGTIKYRSRLETGYSDPSSLETFTDKMVTIQSVLEERGANKIIIQGVDYVKLADERKVWDAADTGSFQMVGDKLGVDVANLGVFPNTDDWPSYWAKYDDVISE